MEKIISAKVIYSFFTGKKVYVNLLQSDGGVIALAITGVPAQDSLKKLAAYMRNYVRLVLVDGQVRKMFLVADSVEVDLKKNPQLGVTFRESSCQKFSGAFVKHRVDVKPLQTFIFIAVENEDKKDFILSCGMNRSLRLIRFLNSCQKGDILRIFQDEEGKVRHIVNQTKAMEVAC